MDNVEVFFEVPIAMVIYNYHIHRIITLVQSSLQFHVSVAVGVYCL